MLHEDFRTLGQAAPLKDQERASPVLQKNWQDLIKPTKLNVVPGRDPARLATVVADPLERGFGLTLGNALRRVLLSSLQGAAITSVHIDGVLHEFSSIPGVREDVTDIVLNIKEIALRQHADGVKRMVLKKEGPGVARADGPSRTRADRARALGSAAPAHVRVDPSQPRRPPAPRHDVRRVGGVRDLR